MRYSITRTLAGTYIVQVEDFKTRTDAHKFIYEIKKEVEGLFK